MRALFAMLLIGFAGCEGNCEKQYDDAVAELKIPPDGIYEFDKIEIQYTDQESQEAAESNIIKEITGMSVATLLSMKIDKSRQQVVFSYDLSGEVKTEIWKYSAP